MGLKEKLEELASKQYRRVARGLDPSEVEPAIRQIVDIAREVIQRNEAMEKELVQFREQEGWMKRTLVHAERIASAIQEEATKEALTVRAKAEIEAAEIVDQTRKKTEVQERVLINRRTLVEKRMALYEHESNLLLYRLHDLAKHHVDELGQEVSSEVKSLLQRMGTDWEMLPQLPFPVSEGPSNIELPEAKPAAMETPLSRIVPTESGTAKPPARTVLEPAPLPPRTEPFVSRVPEPSVVPALRKEPTAVLRAEDPASPTRKESIVLRTLEGAPSLRTIPNPANSLQGSTSSTGTELINFANPLEELAAITAEEDSVIEKAKEQAIITSPVATATSAVRLPLPVDEKESVDGAHGEDLSIHRETDSLMQTKSAREAVSEKKPPSENGLPSSTGAWGEERQRVEESLLCGRRLVREIRDTQGRLVVGSGALVTRELIHFLIGKGLYGELVASVSDEKEPAR